MDSENLNNATVQMEIYSTCKIHTRFQSLNRKKDNIKLLLFNMKMIIIFRYIR